MAVKLSNGQQKALDQLKRIGNVQNTSFSIDFIDLPEEEGQAVIVDVSIDCKGFERTKDGLSLKDREPLSIYIFPEFPYTLPEIWLRHTRFDGFPHVQHKSYLCLYQATDTEWKPENGMYGFIRRLHSWLQDAAINQLDPVGGPLHPPAVYSSSDTTVLVNNNVPVFKNLFWYGGVENVATMNNHIELGSWEPFLQLDSSKKYIPAILLSDTFSFEYPKTVTDLIRQLTDCGVTEDILTILLSFFAKKLEKDEPLYFVIGTPARGISGEEDKKLQHLAVWELKDHASSTLNLMGRVNELEFINTDENNNATIAELQDDVRALFRTWAENAKVTWCYVMENRPEIVTRRDDTAPANIFHGKRAVVIGCGALGSHIAEHLVRAGIEHITLADKSFVNPGILVRQNFQKNDIGLTKPFALQRRLEAIRGTENFITRIYGRIHRKEDELKSFLTEADFVFDTTASLLVRTKIEELWPKTTRHAVLSSMMIDKNAQIGGLAISGPKYSGASLDIFRKLGISATSTLHMNEYVEAFWSNERSTDIFQPEPGCSEPTFIGSNSDIATLAAQMLNRIAIFATSENKDTGEGHLISGGTLTLQNKKFIFSSDIVIKTLAGTDVRITKNAWRDMNGWISEGSRLRGNKVETGGLVFGHLNDVANVLWINEVVAPPVDSEFDETEFICGTERTQEVNLEKKERSKGLIHFIGSWHTHPISPAEPSQTDLEGMASVFVSDIAQSPKQVMLIIGYASTRPEIGAHLFHKLSVEHVGHIQFVDMEWDGNIVAAPRIEKTGKKIALALSGGGSRAVAYHLGCLKALKDLNLLDDIEVVSGVSGGSVISAMYAYTTGSFEDFESRTTQFLRSGLVRPCLILLFSKLKFVPLFLSFVLATIPIIFLGVFKFILIKTAGTFHLNAATNWIDRSLNWPIPRWYTRTHVLKAAFEKYFGDNPLDADTKNDIDVILNACELSTGTAFRMSNRKIYAWRFGELPPDHLSICDAVTASAAYPPALPAFDMSLPFINKYIGENKKKRVILTDGGIYENLGVSCIEPGKSSEFSPFSYNPDIIISCDAGAGQFKGDKFAMTWPTRMMHSFEAVFRKVQDATKSKLHTMARNGEIEAFVYTNLGQIDRRVPETPSEWITREDVMDYPTDFSAMSDEDITLLTRRGELLTRRLVSRYLF